MSDCRSRGQELNPSPSPILWEYSWNHFYRYSYIYSVSVKSYQYLSFDILENINCSSMATFTFMFLVNDRLVWRDKTVPWALELWCTWFLCSQFLRIWNHHLKRLHAIKFSCPRRFHWKRHQNGLNHPIEYQKWGSNFKVAPKICTFLYDATENSGVRQEMGIMHSDVMDTVIHRGDAWDSLP